MRAYKAKEKWYTRDELLNATGDVRNGIRKAYAASKFYKIPRTTIVNHVSEKVHGFQRWRKTALTNQMERDSGMVFI